MERWTGQWEERAERTITAVANREGEGPTGLANTQHYCCNSSFISSISRLHPQPSAPDHAHGSHIFSTLMICLRHMQTLDVFIHTPSTLR